MVLGLTPARLRQLVGAFPRAGPRLTGAFARHADDARAGELVENQVNAVLARGMDFTKSVGRVMFLTGA